ncbi:MAG: hypothetical protein ACMUIL_08585 [bacterium]
MSSCHDMRMGEIYMCEDCGLEIKVVKECMDVGTPEEECTCHDAGGTCAIECCGKPLVKKD